MKQIQLFLTLDFFKTLLLSLHGFIGEINYKFAAEESRGHRGANIINTARLEK